MEPSTPSDAIYYPSNSNKSGFASAFSFWKEHDDKLKLAPTSTPITSANTSRSRLYTSGTTPRTAQTSPRQGTDLEASSNEEDATQNAAAQSGAPLDSGPTDQASSSEKSTPRNPDDTLPIPEAQEVTKKASEEEPAPGALSHPIVPTPTPAVVPVLSNPTPTAPVQTAAPSVPPEVVRAVTPVMLADLPTRTSKYWSPSPDSSAPSSPISRKHSTIISSSEPIILLSKRSSDREMSTKITSGEISGDKPVQPPPKPEEQITVTVTATLPETRMEKASSTVLAATNSKDAYRPLDKLIMSSTHKLKIATHTQQKSLPEQTSSTHSTQAQTTMAPPKLAETSGRTASVLSMDSDRSRATVDSVSTQPLSESTSINDGRALEAGSSSSTDSLSHFTAPSSSDLFSRRRGSKANSSAPGILKANDPQSAGPGPIPLNTRLLHMMGGSQNSALSSRSDDYHHHQLSATHPIPAASDSNPVEAAGPTSASIAATTGTPALHTAQSSHDFWMRSDQFLLELSEGSPRSSTSTTRSEASSLASSPALSRATPHHAHTGTTTTGQPVGAMSPVSERSATSHDTKSSFASTPISVISVAASSTTSSSSGNHTHDSSSIISGAGSTAGSTPVAYSVLRSSAPSNPPTHHRPTDRVDITPSEFNLTSDESNSEATTDDSVEEKNPGVVAAPQVAVIMSSSDSDSIKTPSSKKKRSEAGSGGTSASSSPGEVPSKPKRSPSAHSHSTSLTSPSLAPLSTAPKRSRSKDSITRRKKKPSSSTKKEPILEEVEPRSPRSLERENTDTDVSGTLDSETYSATDTSGGATRSNGSEKAYVSIPIDLSLVTVAKASSTMDSPSSSTATPHSTASGERTAAHFPRRDKVGANPALSRAAQGSPVSSSSSSTPKLRVHRQYSSETLRPSALTSKTETDLFVTESPTKFARNPSPVPPLRSPDPTPSTPTHTDSATSARKKAASFFNNLFGSKKNSKAGGLSPSVSKTDLSSGSDLTGSEGGKAAAHKRRKSSDQKAGGKTSRDSDRRRYTDLGTSLQEGNFDEDYDSEMSLSMDVGSRPRGNSVAGIPISGSGNTGNKTSNGEQGLKTSGSRAAGTGGGLTDLLGREFGAATDHRSRSTKGLSLPSSPYDSESETSGANQESTKPGTQRRAAGTIELLPSEARSRTVLTVAEPGTPTLRRRNSFDPSTARDSARSKKGDSSSALDFSQMQTLSPTSASTARSKDQKKKDKKSTRDEAAMGSASSPSSPKKIHFHPIFGIALETLASSFGGHNVPMSPLSPTSAHPLSPGGAVPSTPSTSSASASVMSNLVASPVGAGVHVSSASPGAAIAGNPISPRAGEIPDWLTLACNALVSMNTNDLNFEDAFSSTATFSAKDKLLLRKSIEDGSLDISLETDSKMISQAIFTFLEDLPDPVCTYKYYGDFAALLSIDEPRYQLQLLFSLIWSLPPAHRRTLQLLVDFMASMSHVQHTTNSDKEMDETVEELQNKRLTALIDFFAPNVFRSRSFSTLHISPRPYQLGDLKGMSLAQTFHSLTPAAALLSANAGGSGSSSSLLSAKLDTPYGGATRAPLSRRNSKLSGSLEASDTSSMDHAGSAAEDVVHERPQRSSPAGSLKGIIKSSSDKTMGTTSGPAPALGATKHAATSLALVPATVVTSAQTSSPASNSTVTALNTANAANKSSSTAEIPDLLIRDSTSAVPNTLQQTGSSTSISSNASSHSTSATTTTTAAAGGSSPVPRLGLEALRKPPNQAKSQPLHRTKSGDDSSGGGSGGRVGGGATTPGKVSPFGTPGSSAPNSPSTRMSPRSHRTAIELFTLIFTHREYLFSLESAEFAYEWNAAANFAAIEFGTLDYLFDLLGNPHYRDSDFASSLFVGAGQKISPEEILARVMSRVRAGDSAKDFVRRRCTLLLNALRQWVYSAAEILATAHPGFFVELTQTVNSAKMDEESFLLAELLADLTIAKGTLAPPASGSSSASNISSASPPPVIDVTYVPPLSTPIIGQSVETLAQHLMLIDLEHLKALKLRKQLTDSAADFLASDAFVSMTTYFNTLSRWVAYEIVIGPNQKERRLRVLYFAQVAHCLVELNDFNSALAVYSGITSFSVSRMTKMMVSARKKAAKYLDSLEHLFSMSRNYKAYNDRLRQCQLPAIPQIVLYARNLSSLNENNPDFEGEKMNIGKLKDFVRLAQDLLKYQKSVLYYHKDIALYNALTSLAPPDDDEIEAESKRTDPPKK